MSKVIQFASEAWNEVEATTLRKSFFHLYLPSPQVLDKDVYESLSQAEYDDEDEEEPTVHIV